MSYEQRPADDRIEEYLKSTNDPARPREIAAALGLSKSYVTRRCKVMAEAGRILRHEGRYIVGHDIPGYDDPVILTGDRDHLLGIVETVDKSRLSEARGKTIDDLRKFIRQNFVRDTFPLGNRRVSYAAA